MYFRKIDAAIREDLRKTIAAQQAEIESLWTENPKLRKEANDDGAADTDEGDGK
jgi:cell division protein FtsB